MFSKRAALMAAVLLSAAPACRRVAPEGAVRLAVIPFENQSGDASLDWAGKAASVVLTAQLAPAPEVRVIAARNVREARRMGARRALSGYITSAGGRARVSCVLEDLESRKALKTLAAAGNVLPLFDQVARAISPHARRFPSTNQEALRLLAAGEFERAAAADPDLGLAYLGWARGDRAAAPKILALAQARGDRIAPIERAEIGVLEAGFSGDSEARLRAMRELAALTPSDARLARAIGELEMNAWRFPAAVEWHRRAARIEPDAADTWNLLAYAQAFADDLAGARNSIQEYGRLAPGNPNADDSLGEIEFMAGNFSAAERGFLAAQEKDATWQGAIDLAKAAHARALTGDLAAADALMARYLEARKGFQDPLIEFRRAQWEFLTGRRREAMQRMEAFRAASKGETAARAALQLAAWKRQTGDRENAARLAAEGARLAESPAGKRLGAVLRFVCDTPATASEWAVRAERAFPERGETSMKQYALAYALLLDGHFPAAAVLLKQMLRGVSPTASGDLRALAAWALLESGKPEEARPLAALNPLPETFGESTFRSLAVPRFLLTRARLATGKDADRWRGAYERLKGDVADAR